ncbi:copper resistance protein CopC [Streptomyces sp. RFCAC02]|uniref:copper resistance CopC/CopD family protein n=1 Tax=Streptomyces sp. RFCAC02 TaxID=2499143 RepID=UPI00101F5695|nr:copper resistance protein CopC [Streptomyces sp. RFCAC02]
MTALPYRFSRPEPGPGPRRRRHRALAALLACAGALAALLIAAPAADAHAALTGTDPEDGAVVAEAPDEVTLTFSESVSVGDGGIRVLAPDGSQADTGRPTGSGTTHGVALAGDLGDGTYTVAWHVVSADSHPVAGAFTFSIGAPSDSSVDLAAVAGRGDDGAVGLLYDIGRYASYAGFVLLFGSCAFVLVCWPVATGLRAAQRVTLTGWTLLAAGTVALLLLRTPYTGSGELSDVFDLGGLRDVVETRTGTALVTRLLLTAAAGAFVAVLYGWYARLRADRAAGEDTDDSADDALAHAERVRDVTFGLLLAGGILTVGTAATWSMSEHASTGRQTGLAIPADVAHLLAVAAWLGGLATLLTLLARSPLPLPRAAVARYSAVALTSVAVLAVTGLYQSWRQVGLSWDALTGTSYGQLLMVKVALVAAMLVAAGFSRRWTGRLMDRAEAGTAAPEPEPEPVPAAAGGAEDPERARQLARQRDAVAATARRRARDGDPERSGLRRSVLAETVIAAVLLAVTTALTATTPAHTAADAPAAADGSGEGGGDTVEPSGPVSVSMPFDTGGPGGQGTAALELTPARTGENTLHITLTDPQGEPLDVAEIKVALTLPADDLGPLRHDPVPFDSGHWTVTDVQLPLAGDWQLALTLRTSDIDQVTETATVPIG